MSNSFPKSYILYGSHIKFKNRQIKPMVLEVRIVVTFGGLRLGRGAQGRLWGLVMVCVLIRMLVTWVYSLCEKSLNCTLKMCALSCMCATLELKVYLKALRSLRPLGVDETNPSENPPIPGGPTSPWRCTKADEDSKSNVPKSSSSHPFCGYPWSSHHPLFLRQLQNIRLHLACSLLVPSLVLVHSFQPPT